LAHLFDFFSPWSFLVIPAGIWCYKNRPLPNLVRFALIWLGVVFVLLTLTVNKQTQYALLLLPPITIILGYYLEVATGKFYQFNRVIFWLLCTAVAVIIALAMRKHGWPALTSPQSVILLLLTLLPLALKKIFKVVTPKLPILIAAALAVFMYLYTEQFLTKDEAKSDIKVLMQTARGKEVLYQTMPGDGSVSFYAQRPIKPLTEEQMQLLVNSQAEFWLVGKHAPAVKSVKLDKEAQVGDWTLWKLTKLP
jgi:4-amino-4-deoxy-L-arabinose transferase-like glycosyltransferase